MLAAIGLAPAAPQATVPQVMNYQGILKDTAGDPLTGTYTMTFRIYDSVVATTTAALWSEEHVNVTAREGRFNVLLGYNTPLPDTLFSQPDRYIGVTVAPYDEMAPRQRLASVPYAFHADYAFRLAAADGDPLDAVTVDNDGNVAIAGAGSTIELGAGVGKESEAGKIGYQTWSDGLDIVGAGTTVDGRKIRFWNEGGAIFNGNVGIGTTSPSARLDVNGSANVSGNAYVNGNVGIGTESPTQKLDVVGDRIRLLDLAGTKEIVLRTDGSAVNVDAYNADLYLYAPNGNIHMQPGGGSVYWTGHLASMQVSGEYHVNAPAGGWDSVDMGSAENSICFLVGTFFNDVDASDEWVKCAIDIEGGHWKLKAYESDNDNDAECEARCLSW